MNNLARILHFRNLSETNYYIESSLNSGRAPEKHPPNKDIAYVQGEALKTKFNSSRDSVEEDYNTHKI